jgi:hypothetical protein
MNMIEFYTRVINSYGLTIKDDVVYIGENPIVINGKKVLMPKDENFDKVLVNGEVKYIFFNILKEDRIKNIDPVLIRLLKISEITHGLMVKNLAIGLLYEIYKNNNKLHIPLADLLTSLDKARGNAKTLV